LKDGINDFFTREAGRRLILSGAGAAARGAYEAGAGLVLTYPGSPVVETFDLLASHESPLKDRCDIVINEHVAYHQALGYSLTGGRSFIIIKHVGVNVCADPMHYSAYTGVNGGMVILTGSDPGANCSTGEFDVRFYSLHTHIPIFEPRGFNETVVITKKAFEVSELYKLPVMVVIPSAFCYGVGSALSGAALDIKSGGEFINSRDYTNVGALAVKRHELLAAKIERMRMAEEFRGDGDGNGNGSGKFCGDLSGRFVFNKGALIITSGIYYNFVAEALRELKIDDLNSIYSPALTYPLNTPELLKVFNSHNFEKIIFAEDLEGFLEIQVSSFMAHNKIKADIFGKNKINGFGELKYPVLKQILSQLLCRSENNLQISINEINTDEIKDIKDIKDFYLQPLPREGTFCPGCPHRAFFYALNKFISEYDVIGGDIGCSSLPPHFSSWLACMNSGTSIASGVSLSIAGGRGGQSCEKKQRVVSIIGDSTFFHSGMQTIMQCAASNSDQICFILDNGWTAMTGHQPTFTTKPLNDSGHGGQRVSIKKILEAFGVKRIFEIDPFRVDKFKALLNELSGAKTNDKDFTAVIVKRECRMMAKKRSGEKNKKIDGRQSHKTVNYHIINQRCAQCNECYSVLSCPAIFKDDGGELYINQDICDGCGICFQICPNGAIAKSEVEYGG
jgi:indolepyruvate ferredoxin oxidoreductase alpha subunit